MLKRWIYKGSGVAEDNVISLGPRLTRFKKSILILIVLYRIDYQLKISIIFNSYGNMRADPFYNPICYFWSCKLAALDWKQLVSRASSCQWKSTVQYTVLLFIDLKEAFENTKLEHSDSSMVKQIKLPLL